jgi:hypothetical protein
MRKSISYLSAVTIVIILSLGCTREEPTSTATNTFPEPPEDSTGTKIKKILMTNTLNPNYSPGNNFDSVAYFFAYDSVTHDLSRIRSIYYSGRFAVERFEMEFFKDVADKLTKIDITSYDDSAFTAVRDKESMKLAYSGSSSLILYLTKTNLKYTPNTSDTFFVSYTNNKISRIYDPALQERADFTYDLTGNVTAIYDTVVQGNFRSPEGYFKYSFSNQASAISLGEDAFVLFYNDKSVAREMLFQSKNIPIQTQMYSYTGNGYELISFNYQNQFYPTGLPKISSISISNTTHYKYLSSVYYYTYMR